jgi:phosphatidylglycerophosphatase A
MCQVKASSALAAILMATFAAVASIICVKFAPVVIAATGKTDPPEVVTDEFAGQAVTFLISPFHAAGSVSTTELWVTVLVGFLLFRFFDILKPWPIRKLEKLPAGWGVLFDDILAGIYAAVVLQICTRLWMVWGSA